MKIYARIENGRVVEVFDLHEHFPDRNDIEGMFPPALKWVEATAVVKEGWYYLNEEVLCAPDDYRILRIYGDPCYAPLAEQLDMQYKDTQDGGTRWVDHISAVKAAWPKP